MYISDSDLVWQIYLTHIKNSFSAVNFVLKAFVISNLISLGTIPYNNCVYSFKGERIWQLKKDPRIPMKMQVKQG